MNGSRCPTPFRKERYLAGKRPVDLKDPHSITEFPKLPPVERRPAAVGKPEQLPRRQVKKNAPGRRQLRKRGYGDPRLDLAAHGQIVSPKRIGNRHAATPRDRPSLVMARCQKQQGDSGSRVVG